MTPSIIKGKIFGAKGFQKKKNTILPIPILGNSDFVGFSFFNEIPKRTIPSVCVFKNSFLNNEFVLPLNASSFTSS